MRRWVKKDAQGSYRFILEPKYDRNELAKNILRGLVVGGLIAASLALPNLAQFLRFFEPADRRKVRQVFGRLKRKRLVRIYEKDGLDIIELTEDGRKKIQSWNVDEMVLNTKRRWDGWWRMIIFDIPESCRPARVALQTKLGQLGFYCYQKSVYITPHRCRTEFEFLREFFGVSKYMKYCEVKELDDELLLIKHFGLL